MPNSCAQFGQNRDLLGKSVSFQYKGSGRYGTAVGGYMSMAARIFIWIVAAFEIYQCLIITNNQENTKFNQLEIPNGQVYDVSVEEGFPAFYLYTTDADGFSSVNNETLFDFSFEIKTESSTREVPAIYCNDFVEKYVSSEYSRQQILSQFYFNGKIFLCPDLASYKLQRTTWLFRDNTSEENLRVKVTAKPDQAEVITWDTEIFHSWIYPFYNFEEYRDNDSQLQYASTSWKTHYADIDGTPQINFMQIQQRKLSIYNNLWFDLNSINFFELGNVFFVYETTSVYPEQYRERGNDRYIMAFSQSRDQMKTKWTVTAMNQVWGQIGGYTALVWMVVTFLLSDYEQHKFRSSLISSVYFPTKKGPEAPACETEEHSRSVLKKAAVASSKFGLLYREVFTTWLITLFCSFCCKDKEWYQRRQNRQKVFTEANQKLNKEIDLHTILNTGRLTNFIASLMNIQTHQRVLLNRQKKFQVKTLRKSIDDQIADNRVEFSQLLPDVESDEEGELSSELAITLYDEALLDENQRNLAWLLNEFSPQTDEKDDILMEGITGFSLQDRGRTKIVTSLQDED